MYLVTPNTILPVGFIAPSRILLFRGDIIIRYAPPVINRKLYATRGGVYIFHTLSNRQKSLLLLLLLFYKPTTCDDNDNNNNNGVCSEARSERNRNDKIH